MPDPVVDYLDKCTALAMARERVGKLVARLRGVAARLEDKDAWQNCYVSGAGNVPPDLSSGRSEIAAADWPGPRDFHEALVAWFRALEAARDAWSALPPRERSDFEGPDHYQKVPRLLGWPEPVPSAPPAP